MLGQLESTHSAFLICFDRVQFTYLDSYGMVHAGDPLRRLHVQVRQKNHALGTGLSCREFVEVWKHVCWDKSGVSAIRSLDAVGIAIEAIRDAHRSSLVRYG